MEELDPWWRPSFPNVFPRRAEGRALERGEVSGAGRVVATGHPLPEQLVRGVVELHAFDGLPDQEVLPNLVEPKRAMDVSCPGVDLQAVRHSPKLPSALGDASIQQRRDLADGPSIEPPVLPEQGLASVPDLHRGGCEEQGALIGGEL